MFHVEVLEKEKHIESRKLWEQVFCEDSKAFLDAYYSQKGASNEINVIRDDNGEICAMIQWNPVELSFGSDNCVVDYLVAVATRADMRRKGMMAMLLTYGLEKRKQQGMPFVFLTPAQEAYYEPFGFVTVGQSYQCQLKDVLSQQSDEAALESNFLQAASVSIDNKNETDSYKVRVLKKEEYEQAAKWANGILKKAYSLFVTRSPKYFAILQKELASEGGNLIGVFHKNTLKGLFGYTMVGGLELREPICDKKVALEVYKAINDYFKESAQDAIVVGCDKNTKNALPCAKTMVHVLSPEGLESVFADVYLNEVV